MMTRKRRLVMAYGRFYYLHCLLSRLFKFGDISDIATQVLYPMLLFLDEFLIAPIEPRAPGNSGDTHGHKHGPRATHGSKRKAYRTKAHGTDKGMEQAF